MSSWLGMQHVCRLYCVSMKTTLFIVRQIFLMLWLPVVTLFLIFLLVDLVQKTGVKYRQWFQGLFITKTFLFNLGNIAA